MTRNQWLKPGIVLTFIIILAGFALAAGQAQAQKNALQPPGLITSTLDTPEIFFTTTSGSVESLTGYRETVFWSMTHPDCPGGEFAEPCVIHRQSAGYLTIQNSSAGVNIRSSLAVDGDYVYFGKSSGQIARTIYYWGGRTAETLAAKENSALGGDVAVDDSYVYWTENDSASSGKLFRAPKSGGARQQMYDSPFGAIKQLRADGSGGVLFIANCFLCPDTLTRVTPSGGGFTAAYGRPYVQAYTLIDNTVYFALDFGDNNLHLESAPLASLNSVTQGPDLSDTAVSVMVADDTNLYYQHGTGGSGPLFRLSRSGFSSSSPTAITASLSAIGDLYNSGDYLFWRNAAAPRNSVYRLSVNAAATQVDAGVTDIEVTQGIQNLDNNVIPVQKKWTMARVYPELISGSVPTITTSIRLYGERDGAPLPGSPLHAEMVMVTTAGNLRENLDDTANFILPPSWLTGTVTLTADLSVLGLYDTAPANNSKSVTVNFANKANVCVKFLPIETTSRLTFRVRNLASGTFTPGFQEVYRRFTTLWPAPAVPYYTQSVALRKPCLLCAPNPPFNMVGASDKELLNLALYEHNIWDSPPDYCGGNNARTHYVAMVHPGINTSMGSITWLGFASYGEPLSSVKFTQGGGASWEIPKGGATMGQELGHNFNDLFGASSRWKHINCNLPTGDGFNGSYPYPPCQIGPPASSTGLRPFWGYDRLSNTLIQPEQASDFMSYGANQWVSDYTWSGLMDQTSDAPAAVPALVRPVALNGETLLIAGWVTEDETAAGFASVYRVASTTNVAQQAAEFVQKRDAAVQSGHDHETAGSDSPFAIAASYNLELLSAAGSVLASQPITPTAGTHVSAGPENSMFYATMPFASGAAALRVTKDGAELGRQAISANAPAVTISQPAAGAVIGSDLTIAWTGSDADGDLLKYVVQYSADNGASWTAVTTAYTGNSLVLTDTTNLPGSSNARIRIVASDGVNTAMATSPPFTMLGHAPWPMIDTPLDGRVYLNQETVTLIGLAQDPEEGFLDDAALSWEVTGPATRSGAGRQVTLTGLPPGQYTVTLTATDSSALTAVATSTFFVSPKRIYDGGAAVMDGRCSDAAYNSDLEPILLHYPGGETAVARFSYSGGDLYVCYDGLPVSASNTESIRLNLDLNNSGDDFSQTDDLVIYVRRDGSIRSGYGDGSGGEAYDVLPQGVTAAVGQDNGVWRVELRIDSSRLSGAASLIRLYTDHFGGAGYAQWPMPASYISPASWGLVTLSPQPQTIAFAALPDRAYQSGLFTVSASASSGLPVSFTTGTPAVCAVDGNIVTLLTTGVCAITAGQAGNSSYQAATAVSRSFTVFTTEKLLFLPVIRKSQ